MDTSVNILIFYHSEEPANNVIIAYYCMTNFTLS